MISILSEIEQIENDLGLIESLGWRNRLDRYWKTIDRLLKIHAPLDLVPRTMCKLKEDDPEIHSIIIERLLKHQNAIELFKILDLNADDFDITDYPFDSLYSKIIQQQPDYFLTATDSSGIPYLEAKIKYMISANFPIESIMSLGEFPYRVWAMLINTCVKHNIDIPAELWDQG